MNVFLHILLVLFVGNLKYYEVVLFCVCVVCPLFCVTRLSDFLVCILWSCFLFVVLFWFFIRLKRKDTKNRHTKTPKTKMQKKRHIFSARAVVFTNRVPNFSGVGLEDTFFGGKRYKSSGFNILRKRPTMGKNSKRLSQKLVQRWVKDGFQHVAQHKWTNLWLKNGNLYLSLFLKISFSLQKEEHTNVKGKRQIGPIIDSKQGNVWTKFWLYNIHMLYSKNLSKIWPFLSRKSGQGWVKYLSKIFLLVSPPPILKWFLGI